MMQEFYTGTVREFFRTAAAKLDELMGPEHRFLERLDTELIPKLLEIDPGAKPHLDESEITVAEIDGHLYIFCVTEGIKDIIWVDKYSEHLHWVEQVFLATIELGEAYGTLDLLTQGADPHSGDQEEIRRAGALQGDTA